MSNLKKVVTEAVVQVVKPAETKYHLELTPAEMASVLLGLGHLCDQSKSRSALYFDLSTKLCEHTYKIPTLKKHTRTGAYVVTDEAVEQTINAMDL